jgi:hypothetical protein
MSAADMNRWELVYMLMERGANLGITDRWGYDLARQLEKFGSKGTEPGSQNARWYRTVVEDPRIRRLMEPEAGECSGER